MDASRGQAVMVDALDPSIKGKAFFFYGLSDTGKTSQLTKLPNPVLMPLEKEGGAVAGVIKLPTRSWSDVERHLNLLKSKQWTNILNSTDEPICIIIDGAEKLARYAERKVCADAKVAEISQAGTRGKGYKKLENLVINFITDLLNLDYAVIFIGHETVFDDGYIFPKGDRKRGIDAIIENCDVVTWLESQPLDPETNQPGMSIAHFFSGTIGEDGSYFARCRYVEMQPTLNPFTAEGFVNVLHDAVVAEAKRLGVGIVDAKSRLDFKTQQNKGFDMPFAECKDVCLDMMDELDEKGRGGEVDKIILANLESVEAFNDISEIQIDALYSIYHALSTLVEED